MKDYHIIANQANIDKMSYVVKANTPEEAIKKFRNRQISSCDLIESNVKVIILDNRFAIEELKEDEVINTKKLKEQVKGFLEKDSHKESVPSEILYGGELNAK